MTHSKTSDPPSVPIQLFYLLSAGLILLGLVLGESWEIGQGLWAILTSPSRLITDYLEVGGIGACLINAGLVLALHAIMAGRVTKTVTGPLFAALFCVLTFSFFGKNLYNTLPLTLGSWLYARFKGEAYQRFLLTSLFATGLSPVVSLLSFNQRLPLGLGIPLGVLAGIVIGFVIPPIASSFLRFHQGYILYNIGFVCGVIGMIFTGILRGFGLPVEAVSILSAHSSPVLLGLLVGLSLLFLLLGVAQCQGKLSGYRLLLQESGRAVTDFVSLYGTGLTYFNVGLMGLVGISYVLLVGGNFNGPVTGAILMVMGFGAYGKHLGNVLPVMVGVSLTQALSALVTAETANILAALFGTTLAPIAGQYGPLAGLAAGALHATLTPNLSAVHAGLTLYHNGFSSAFVAAVMVPVLNSLKERKADHDQ